MEEQLSEVLDNILGLLLLEGSYEIEDTDEAILVSIDTPDAGRLIGARGESLEGLQLLVNQILYRKQDSSTEEFKRVIFDVAGWKKQREEDLKKRTEQWGNQVLQRGQEMEIEPMSSWQRRVVHMAISEMEGVESESVGEGRDRHVVIKVKSLSRAKSRDEKN